MRFKTSFKTTWVIIISMALLIAIDIWAFGNNIDGDTISEITIRNSIRHPIIPFTFGVIMGHLFWPQVAEVDKNE